jgi:hypothetical protein
MGSVATPSTSRQAKAKEPRKRRIEAARFVRDPHIPSPTNAVPRSTFMICPLRMLEGYGDLIAQMKLKCADFLEAFRRSTGGNRRLAIEYLNESVAETKVHLRP